MGWLRDLMTAAPDPPASYGDLARRLLAHEDWPNSTRMQERSLAALFSKLDRGEGLDWILERPSVQHLLSETLGCGVAHVRRAIGGLAPSHGEAVRLVRLQALPRARTLDLLEEGLFPGIPSTVLQPEGWRLLWWEAPSGSGRSLVGSWLTTRQRAHTLGAEEDVPHRGIPCFIELHSHSQLKGALSNPPSERVRWCIAAPFPPPPTWLTAVTEIVRTPPARDYLPTLLEWIAERYPEAHPFDRGEALRWLASPQLLPLIDSPGAVLELCGLLDEYGRDATTRRTPRELGESWLAARTRVALDRGDSAVAHLTTSGLALIAGMLRHALADSAEVWDAARSFDEWLALVPGEFQRGGDVEWLEVTLHDSGLPIRPRDIRRAAQRVPPGAFRAVRALSQVGMLTPVWPGSVLLGLGPRWLANVALSEARRMLAASSALEWGEVLLGPNAVQMHEAIAEQLRDEPALVVEATLDEAAPDEPAYACAIETLILHVGLGLVLDGTQDAASPLSDEMQELVEEQLTLLVELPGLPPAPRAWPQWAGGTRICHGAWLLALLALTEAGMPGRRQGSFFDVWRASKLPPEWRTTLDLIEEAIALDRGAGWARAAYGLVDRVRHAVGSVAEDGQGWHVLERPGLFIEEAVHGALTWTAVLEFSRSSRWWDAIQWLREQQHVEAGEFAGAIWRCWCEAGGPALDGSVLDPESPQAGALWAHCPPAALDLLVRHQRPVAYSALSANHWAYVMSGLEEGRSTLLDDTRAWAFLPQDCSERLLRAGALLPARGWEQLWRHHAPRTAQAARDLQRQSIDACALAAALAPPDAAAPALELLESLTLQNLSTTTWPPLRAWLAEVVRLKCPEWRRAYALLMGLDRAIASLRPR